MTDGSGGTPLSFQVPPTLVGSSPPGGSVPRPLSLHHPGQDDEACQEPLHGYGRTHWLI